MNMMKMKADIEIVCGYRTSSHSSEKMFHHLVYEFERVKSDGYSCHKRQKAQAPTPQAPIRNCKTRKVTNAKVQNRYTNLTLLNLT